MTRIAVIMPHLKGGGIERCRLNLIRDFISRGLSVDLVVARFEGELVDQVPVGAEVIKVAKKGKATFLFGFLKYLREKKPSYIISAFDDVSVMVVLANSLLGSSANVLISSHNTLSMVIARSKGFKLIKYCFLRLALRWAYEKAYVIVAVSAGVADDLSKVLGLPRERIKTIYNPVITHDFEERMSAPIESSVFDMTAGEHRRIILFVGRLCDQKRVDILIKAF